MTVTLQPMPEERLVPWLARGHEEYVRARIEAGETRAIAEDKATKSDAELFPDGRPLASHRIFGIVAEGEVVGLLWIGPELEGSDHWWIYDVEIDPAHRRRGYAHAALDLGHAQARALGATAIGLNVFGYNTGARELYEKLGYDVRAVQMQRSL